MTAKVETPLYPIVLDAARHMREHHGPDHQRSLFWHALADWLQTIGEKERARKGAGVQTPVLYFREALVIADSYLSSVTS